MNNNKRELTEFMQTAGAQDETIKWSYDEYNNIYVNGKRLAVIDKIALRNKELWFLGITCFAVLVQAIASIAPWIAKILKCLFYLH